MDVNELFEITPDKTNRRWLYVLAAVVLIALLAAWYWHNYGGRGETDAVIDRLRESTTTSERRVNAIVNATARREVTARGTARKNVDKLRYDELVVALERLLAEYRTGH